MNPASELTLFAILARALAHSVRGDLSVITNDLTYLATLAPPHEVERAKGRCSNIAQSLGKLSIFTHGDPHFTPCSCAQICDSLGIEFDSELDSKLRWQVDSQLLARALSISRELCGALKSGEVTAAAVYTCKIDASTGTLTATGNFERSTPGRTDARTDTMYRSLTEFALEERGEGHVVDAVIGDLILRAHNAGVTIAPIETSSETLAGVTGVIRVILSLPAVDYTC